MLTNRLMEKLLGYWESWAMSHTSIGQKYIGLREEYARLLRDREELEKTNARLRKLSLTDDLTGLGNRRYFDQELERLIALAHREAGCISLALVDIDHFKGINDTYGHLTGDLVLMETARRLQKNRRISDAFCRYGGEEFAIIMPFTDNDGAFAMAEKIRQRVSSEPCALDVTGTGYEIPLTVSIGLAAYAAHPATRTQDKIASVALIENADNALYSAKQGGRNRVVSAASMLP